MSNNHRFQELCSPHKAYKVVEFLRDTKTEETQRHLARERTSSTGQWFLHSTEFRSWISGEQPTLFCTGPLGSGKSVITSLVVDTLREKFADRTDVGIGFYYGENGRSHGWRFNPIRAILGQLSQRCASLPHALVRVFDNYVDKTEHPSSLELLDALASFFTTFSTTYIVVDALDALNGPSRRLILSRFIDLQKSYKVIFLFSSRPRSDIASKLGDCPTLDMNPSNTEMDIIDYINERMHQLPVFKQSDSVFQEQARSSILLKSNGLFIMAMLITRKLAATGNPTEFKEALELTPGTKDEFYVQTIRRIRSFGHETEHLVKAGIAWLLFSKEALKVPQIQHALGMEEKPLKFDKDNLPEMGEIMKACGGLLAVSGADNTFGFSHPTVRDHILASLDKWDPSAKISVARGSIGCLNLDIFKHGRCVSDESFESRLREYPLYQYCARHWGDHLRDICDSALRADEILSFLMDPAKVDSASQAMLTLEIATSQFDYSQNTPQRMTGLHLAAHFGLVSIIELLLAKGQKLTSTDSEGRTPLWIATEKGHEEAMVLLSQRDQITFSSMLEQGKHKLAVSLLIVAGQNIRDTRARTPLHIGAIHNDQLIMKLALQHGSSINSMDEDGKTPLELAIHQMKSDAITWLLQEGAATARIATSSILGAYGKLEVIADTVVELCEERQSGSKRLNMLTHEDFRRSLESRDSNLARLFIFNDESSWQMDDKRDPEGSQWVLYRFVRKDEDKRHWHSILASVPIQSIFNQTFRFEWKTKRTRIAWTMVMVGDLNRGGVGWTSQDHLSTLQAFSVPANSRNFLEQLFKHITDAWWEFCDAIDLHLAKSRGDLLVIEQYAMPNTGIEDTTLVDQLLSDANSWMILRGMLRRQIEKIRQLCQVYEMLCYDDCSLSSFLRLVDEFSVDANARFDRFDNSSSALIQRHFNMTSIRETRISTNISRSMKRLTWITFIFLPLIFVSGLFGMNVDILEANPPWWWYLVFASITLSITVTFWIIFKRFSDLENKLERKFYWLVGTEASKPLKHRA